MATCTGFIEPLNLECLLVNTFAGSIPIFIGIAFLLISILAARFRMPNSIYLISIGLFAVIMASYMQGIYLLVVMVAGFISFYSMARIMKN